VATAAMLTVESQQRHLRGPSPGPDPMAVVHVEAQKMNEASAQALEVAKHSISMKAAQDAEALKTQRLQFEERNRAMEEQLRADEARLADLQAAAVIQDRIEQAESVFQHQVVKDDQQRAAEQARVEAARHAAESERVVCEQRLEAGAHRAAEEMHMLHVRHDQDMAAHQHHAAGMAAERHERERALQQHLQHVEVDVGNQIASALHRDEAAADHQRQHNALMLQERGAQLMAKVQADSAFDIATDLANANAAANAAAFAACIANATIDNITHNFAPAPPLPTDPALFSGLPPALPAPPIVPPLPLRQFGLIASEPIPVPLADPGLITSPRIPFPSYRSDLMGNIDGTSAAASVSRLQALAKGASTPKETSTHNEEESSAQGPSTVPARTSVPSDPELS